jgi:phosphatidate cytidylyltransferase
MTYFFDPVILSGPFHYGVVLGFLVILWLNDTGAYFVGSLIGKHKLFERISPGKTWEGSAGGAVFALLTAWGLSFIFKQLDALQWIFLAILIVISGTLGDLVESMLKRSLGIKDSGTILPGHGGLLDRFDAVFLSAPFVFVYLAFISR